MRRGAFIFSAVLHVTILVVAIVGLPFAKPKPIVTPPPPVVDIVDISKVTQTTHQSSANKIKPATAPKTSKKKPQRTVMKPKKPRTKPKPPSLPKAPALTKKPPDARKPQNVTAKKPDIKKPHQEKQNNKAFDDMLAGLVDLSPDKAEVENGHMVPIGAKMTISESDALRRQLEKCWNVPLGARDAQDLVVEIFMVVNADRIVQDARIVDTKRYARDGFFRAAADSALRAVKSPDCNPLELPPDKYEQWRHIIVTFDPRNMF